MRSDKASNRYVSPQMDMIYYIPGGSILYSSQGNGMDVGLEEWIEDDIDNGGVAY